jgi:mRNA interferase MazF
VPLPPGMKTQGSVLVDQIRTIERGDRIFEIIERAPAEVLSEVRGRLAALLEFDVVSSVVDPGQ